MGKIDFSAINQLSSRRIKHPGYRNCLSFLEELYEEADSLAGTPVNEGRRGSAYLTTARTGVGKTTLLSAFLDSHPAYVNETEMGKQWCVPVALIRVPPACTLKGYISEICRVLKVTTSREHTTSLLTRKAIDGLKNAKARMLVTDETNIIVESANNKEIIHIRNFIKQLIDEADIPVVFFGLPEKCNEFFNSDAQTASRIVMNMNLPEFHAPTSDKSFMYKTTLRYLEYLESDCGMTLADDIGGLEFSQRLYLATKGVMRDIQKIMVESAKYGMRKGKDRLTISDFYEICQYLKLGDELKPFSVSKKALTPLMAKLVAKKRAA